MRQFGEAFKQMVNPMTGQAIPDTPLVALTPTGPGRTGVIYLRPLNTPPAPRDDRSQAQVTDHRTDR